MIPSPKVATYDKEPKMSVHGVAEKVAEVLKKGEDQFVMCNFAPPDMVRFPPPLSRFFLNQIQVGHTGVYDAAVVAINETDKAVGTVYKAAEEAGYILLITADHGNAEQMKDPVTGNPHTAHTTNAVPFIMTGNPDVLKFAEEKGETEKKEEDEEEEGALCDVAPTILAILGLEQPKGVFFNALEYSSGVDDHFI